MADTRLQIATDGGWETTAVPRVGSSLNQAGALFNKRSSEGIGGGGNWQMNDSGELLQKTLLGFVQKAETDQGGPCSCVCTRRQQLYMKAGLECVSVKLIAPFHTRSPIMSEISIDAPSHTPFLEEPRWSYLNRILTRPGRDCYWGFRSSEFCPTC